MNTDTGQIYRGDEVLAARERGEALVELTEKQAVRLEALNHDQRRAEAKRLGLSPRRVAHVPKHPFEYQAPTLEQTDSIKAFRAGMKQLHDAILQDVPACRERSVAITKLEEVSMWLNKAIVFAAPASRG